MSVNALATRTNTHTTLYLFTQPMGSVVTHTYTALILRYMLHDLVIYFQNNALGQHIVVPRLHPIYCKEILYTKEPLWPTLKIPDFSVPMLLF